MTINELLKVYVHNSRNWMQCSSMSHTYNQTLDLRNAGWTKERGNISEPRCNCTFEQHKATCEEAPNRLCTLHPHRRHSGMSVSSGIIPPIRHYRLASQPRHAARRAWKGSRMGEHAGRQHDAVVFTPVFIVAVHLIAAGMNIIIILIASP